MSYCGYTNEDAATNCVGGNCAPYDCKQGDPGCFCISDCKDDNMQLFFPCGSMSAQPSCPSGQGTPFGDCGKVSVKSDGNNNKDQQKVNCWTSPAMIVGYCVLLLAILLIVMKMRKR